MNESLDFEKKTKFSSTPTTATYSHKLLWLLFRIKCFVLFFLFCVALMAIILAIDLFSKEYLNVNDVNNEILCFHESNSIYGCAGSPKLS